MLKTEMRNPKTTHIDTMPTLDMVGVIAEEFYESVRAVEREREHIAQAVDLIAGSIAAGTGLNYECDAIAACVIGGVSFVGGTGKISGIILGVFVLRIIFIALTMLGVSSSSLYIIKGAIILCACALDMRKYLVKK